MKRGVYISFVARTIVDVGKTFDLLLEQGRVLHHSSDMIYQIAPNVGAYRTWCNLIHEKNLTADEFREEVRRGIGSNSIDAYVLEAQEVDPTEFEENHTGELKKK